MMLDRRRRLWDAHDAMNDADVARLNRDDIVGAFRNLNTRRQTRRTRHEDERNAVACRNDEPERYA
jgi:hypothetical protein